ncbi:MAG: chemotaxis response regulator protein-glutamate methylesterase [Actinobacteria bacterium HGW-Actinobacteria-7]|jgi:two-component system chemotaxis response regulator CheB|nr:MAG: chemotaxis response regulator protein-glutamate methylesterase [Actinobacteria bacterium HGW-Actinobacteria-7]
MRLTIRVLVVDDSALIRQMLVRALSMDPRIEIVGTAKNGVEAIEQARALAPDIVTLDIDMPELSGLEALTHIRKHTQARVIMLSSDTDADTIYRALALGAVDFIPKPATGVASSITELTELLLKKIRTAYRIPPEHAPAQSAEGGAAPSPASPRAAASVLPVGHRPPEMLVAIAASTGGPPALERVFAGLSIAVSAAYVVVQHLPAGFSASLARRLTAVGTVPIVEAFDGQVLEKGRGYLIPYGRHATVVRAEEGARLRFIDTPPRHGVCPAADILFESVAREFGVKGMGVVLTGMGSDGAMGSLAIRRAGGNVVVQDEATSVIWGMPGSAVRFGAADLVVPVEQVATEIRRTVKGRTGGYGDG